LGEKYEKVEDEKEENVKKKGKNRTKGKNEVKRVK
jgi:hypothetical protein